MTFPIYKELQTATNSYKAPRSTRRVTFSGPISGVTLLCLQCSQTHTPPSFLAGHVVPFLMNCRVTFSFIRSLNELRELLHLAGGCLPSAYLNIPPLYAEIRTNGKQKKGGRSSIVGNGRKSGYEWVSRAHTLPRRLSCLSACPPRQVPKPDVERNWSNFRSPPARSRGQPACHTDNIFTPARAPGAAAWVTCGPEGKNKNKYKTKIKCLPRRQLTAPRRGF